MLVQVPGIVHPSDTVAPSFLLPSVRAQIGDHHAIPRCIHALLLFHATQKAELTENMEEEHKGISEWCIVHKEPPHLRHPHHCSAAQAPMLARGVPALALIFNSQFLSS